MISVNLALDNEWRDRKVAVTKLSWNQLIKYAIKKLEDESKDEKENQ